jgi:uncharacterized protein
MGRIAMLVVSGQSTIVSTTLLSTMVETIVEVVNPAKIVLFGSQARGTNRLHSDYDFLVVTVEPFGKGRSRRKTAGQVWRALAKFKVPTDILIYSLDEVEHWRQSSNHVISVALSEGKVLYEQPRPS